MRFQFRIDFRHWMVGFTFNRYNLIISLGPINLLFANYRKYQREMEDYILQNNDSYYNGK